MFWTRTSFACLILSITALPASAQTTLSDRIEALLRGNPQFQAQIPARHRLSELELEARPAPGPLVWGASPETLGRIVHGVATERHINCDFDEPSTASGKLEGAWTESFSFATERGGSIAVEVSVSANFPFGSASGSVTGTV